VWLLINDAMKLINIFIAFEGFILSQFSNSQYEILVFILTRNNSKKRTKRWLHQQSKSNLSDAGRHLPWYGLNRRAKLAANALTTIAIILVF
jgi:hypothetical protein